MENKNLTLTVDGTLLYPKKENGVIKYALAMSEEDCEKIQKKVAKVFPGYKLTFSKSDDYDEPLLNIKTRFDVPVFDKNENLIDNPRIYHGAKGFISINIKEYTYMGKKGISAYLSAIVLIENGEPSGVNYNNIMKDLI